MAVHHVAFDIRRHLIPLVAVSAALAIWSDDARATCGDYLSHGESIPTLEGSEPVPFTPVCHGPECRKRSEVPATPAPRRAAPERPVEHAVREATEALSLQKGSAWVRLVDERRGDPPLGPRVDRPPQ